MRFNWVASVERRLEPGFAVPPPDSSIIRPCSRPMYSQSATLYFLIISCEVAFWLILLLGLAVRYVLRREVLSRWLLRTMPLVDVLLLIFTALDLHAGATPTFAHGLAAAYVGFTIAAASVSPHRAQVASSGWV